jgi:signal transduction histidine kinase
MARESITLPAVVPDPPDEERGRRDRVVDATMYLVALAISTATLVDTWELHPPWLRPVAVVAVIATVGALRWRRTHPGAVGIGVAAVSVLLITAPFVALFNAAIRARARDLAVTAGLTIVSCFTNPLLYRGTQSLELEFGAGLGFAGAALGFGLFIRARRQLVRSLHEQADRSAEEARAAERRRIAREMHDVLAHRLSLLSVHAGALEFNADAPAEEVAEAAGVIRESARSALEDLRSVIGVLREDAGESVTEPPQPTLADLPTLV